MTLPSPEICRRIYAAWVLMGAPDWTEADRVRLSDLLAKHGLSMIDLPEVFLAADVVAAPSRPKDRIYERLWRMFGQLGSDNPTIRTTARKKLDTLLTKQQLSWSDFTAILLAYWAGHNASAPAPQGSSAADDDDEFSVNALDLILYLLEDYAGTTPAQRMVIALWALHTHVYDRFEYSPRLGLISPDSGFGKTTLFKLLEQWVSEPKLTKNTTPAAIYRRLEWRPRTTYLLDEAENQGLLVDRVLRAVLDGGYERGGSIDRAGEEFPIYFPCAYALRGEVHDVPLAVLSRSFVIAMKKSKPRKRFGLPDHALVVARQLITKWRATVAPDPDPVIPAPLDDPRDSRLTDNCRVLLSVADSFGPQHGEAARAALIEFCATLPHTNVGIQVLLDIRAVPFDRISKKALVAALHEAGTIWDAWRGPNDQGRPHPLTTGELSRLLRRFGIRAKNYWPSPRLAGSKSFSGYCREDFGPAWAEFCAESSTAPHPSRIMALAKS